MMAFLQSAAFDAFCQRTLALLLDSTVKGVFILALAALVSLALRRRSAALRHVVWVTAFAGLLLLPLIVRVVPAWQLALIPNNILPTPQSAQLNASDLVMVLSSQLGQPRAPVKNHAPHPATPASAPPTSPAAPSSAMPNGAALNSSGTILPYSSSTMIYQSTVPLSDVWSEFLVPLVTISWLCGVMLTLLPLIIGHVIARRRMLRSATPCDDDVARQILELSKTHGLRCPARTLMTSPGTMPMVVGLWRLSLLLPQEFAQWSEEKRCAVILHELAHVQRRDGLMLALARVACAFYWFNPLAWWALRRMRLECELACDDRVLLGGIAPTAYAEHLLNVARTLQSASLGASISRAFAPASAISMARRSQLEGRLLAILDGARRRALPRSKGLAVALVAALGVLIPIAAAQLGQGATSTSKPSAQHASTPTLDFVSPSTAVQQDHHETPDRISKVSWGEPVNGIRAGVEIADERSSIPLNSLFHAVFHVQNVGSKTLKIDMNGLDYRPAIVRDAARQSIMVIGLRQAYAPDAPEVTILQPGEAAWCKYDCLVWGTSPPVGVMKMSGPTTSEVHAQHGDFTVEYVLDFKSTAADAWAGKLSTGTATARIRGTNTVDPMVNPIQWGEPKDGLVAGIQAVVIPVSSVTEGKPATHSMYYGTNVCLTNGSMQPITVLLQQNSTFPGTIIDAAGRSRDIRTQHKLSKYHAFVIHPTEVFVMRNLEDLSASENTNWMSAALADGLYSMKHTVEIPVPDPSQVANFVPNELTPFGVKIVTLETGTATIVVAMPKTNPHGAVGDSSRTSATLVWGRESGGLRAALELMPAQREYVFGQRLGVRFHVQNVSGTTKTLNVDEMSQFDANIQEPLGTKRRIPSAIYHNWHVFKDHTLRPGEIGIFENHALGLGADSKGDRLNNPTVGVTLDGPPGKYRISYPLPIKGVGSNDLETGALEFTIAAATGLTATPTPVPVGMSPSLTWGNSVHGLQAAVEISPHQKHYAIGDNVGVRLHLRNQSANPISGNLIGRLRHTATFSGGSNLLITYWKNRGDQESYSEPFTLTPNESKAFEIGGLELKDPGPRPVPRYPGLPGINPGAFKLRLRFSALEIKDSETGSHYYLDQELETGEVSFVVAEAPSSSPSLAWGAPFDGLRVGAEYLPQQDTYALGESIRVRFHIQNVTDHEIRAEIPIDGIYPEQLQGKREFWNAPGSNEYILPPGETTTLPDRALIFHWRDDPSAPSESSAMEWRLEGRSGLNQMGYFVRVKGAADPLRLGGLMTPPHSISLNRQGETTPRSPSATKDSNNLTTSALAWGAPANGLRMALELDEKEYAPGEKVGGRIFILNAGAGKLEIKTAQFTSWMVDSKNGGPINVNHEAVNNGAGEAWVALQAGETKLIDRFSFVMAADPPWVNAAMDGSPITLQLPGQYRLSCALFGPNLQIRGLGESTQPVALWTAPVTFRIKNSESPVTQGWGSTKEGLRAKFDLVPDQKEYARGQSVRVTITLKNVTDHPIRIHLPSPSNFRALATNGQWDVRSRLWHNDTLIDRRLIVERLLQPGEETSIENLPLQIASGAEYAPPDAKSFTAGEYLSVDGPGKFSLRYALTRDGFWTGEEQRSSGGGSGAPLETASREITVVEKITSNSPASTGLAGGEAVTSTSNSLPWGQPVNGLRAGFELEPKQREYARGQKIGVRIHFQNTGDREIPWMGGGIRFDSMVIKAEPGHAINVKEYPNLIPAGPYFKTQISPGASVSEMHTDLHFDSPPGEAPALGGTYLDAPPGKYTIAFMINGPEVSGATGPAAKMITASQEITITQPESTKALPWGVTNGGLRAAFELIPSQTDYAVGQRVGVLLHIQNVSNSPQALAVMGSPNLVAETSPSLGHEQLARRIMTSNAWEIERKNLQPGETCAIKGGDVFLGAMSQIEPDGFGRIDHVLKGTQGNYGLRYNLTMGAGSKEIPLETGELAVALVAPLSRKIPDDNVSNAGIAGNAAQSTSPILHWGEPVDGMRTAIELSPKKDSYAIGEVVGVRLHFENVGDTPFIFFGPDMRTDKIALRGGSGKVVAIERGVQAKLEEMKRNEWKRFALQPGENIIIENAGVAIGESFLEPGYPMGSSFYASVLSAQPGRYGVQSEIQIPWLTGTVPAGSPRNWVGKIQTGVTEINVAPAPPDLSWGAPIGGMRAGFELINPRASYAAGDKVSVRVHVKNENDHEIEWNSLRIRRDKVVIKDAKGNRQPIYNEEAGRDLIAGALTVHLAPGATAGFSQAGLAFGEPKKLLAEDKSRSDAIIDIPPGTYSIAFEVESPTRDATGSAQGTLLTASKPLIIDASNTTSTARRD